MAKAKAKRTRRAPEHYVNNKEFTAAIVEYAQNLNEVKQIATKENRDLTSEETPMIPHYIGECFLRIAEGLSHKSNFYSYSYRNDMVMDGVENCVKAIHNYNVNAATRSGKPNAFAYFTQIIYFAFLRRIAKEKRQQEIKEKFIASANIDQFMDNDGGATGNSILERMRQRHDNY
jgi:hypothetical protein